MIRLFYSNALEELVRAMLHRATDDRDDWTEPTHVIVPNRNIATFLKLEIARHQGFAANIETTYLYTFFKDLLPPKTKLVDRVALQSLILDAFLDPVFMSSEEMSSAFVYLYEADAPDEKRAVQLAAQVAKLFDEYSLSRINLIDRWPNSAQIDDPIYAETEAWQRALWLEIFAPGGRLEKRKQSDEKIIALRDIRPYLTDANVPKRVHIFGLSYVALAFYKLFHTLSSKTDLCIYTLNPCMEYWEDVPRGWPVSKRKRFVRRTKEQSELMFGDDVDFGSDDPPALRAWGRPGRDHIHLLNMLTDCDFETTFIDPLASGASLLHQLQHDVLVRKPTTEMGYAFPADSSVQVIAAPSIHREVEGIANEIWALIQSYEERGEKLQYQEIAVIVNHEEKDRYQARIRSVFESTHEIPHNIVDITARSNRRFLEAVDHLLHLPFTRFERRAMLQVITHANIIAKYPRSHADLWLKWCDELSVFHGGDATDHRDTYIQPNLYHWEQALKRLMLGVFVADSDTPVALDDGAYLAREVAGTDVHDVSILCALVSDLIADARAMSDHRRTLSGWCDVVREMILRYLEPVTDDDVIAQRWCFERLAKIAEVDFHGRQFSFEVFHDMFSAELDSMRVSRGYYLTDGVVVSSFLPMRPIPFKVVFIAGLGDRHFPQRDPKSPLDLRWVPEFRPQRGDMVSPKSRDEYMFLETIVSTRDRLYLSYVDRDPQTGETQQPSEVLRQLEFILERDYLEGDAETLRRDLPFRRHESATETYLPQVPHEKHASVLRELARDFAEEKERATPGWRELIDIYDRDSLTTRDELLLRLGLQLDRVVPSPENEPSVIIPLRAIKRFLQTPLQGSAEFLLNVRDDMLHDVLAVEEEQFDLDFRRRDRLLQTIFERYLELPGTPLADHLDREIELETLRGSFPSGVFGNAERQRQWVILNHWQSNLDSLGYTPDDLFRLSLGEGSEPPLDLGTVAVDFDRDVTVKISGTTGFLHREKPIAMPVRGQTYTTHHSQKWVLDSFVDLCVKTVRDQPSANESWNVVFNIAAPPRANHVTNFSSITADEAKAFLTRIASEMLLELHDYVLPVEAIFARRKENISLEEAVERARADRSARFRYGPIRNVDEFDLPEHADAIIARRFGLFFDRKEER